MFIDPVSLTKQMLEVTEKSYQYKGLLNANFQDYMDSLAKSGQLQIQAAKLSQRISALGSGIGMAAGALGGPAGIALGFAIGSRIGKYLGNVASDRYYGRAIADMSEIMYTAKLRHAQLASSYALNDKMLEAVDTLRQNENKRKKDDLQAMSV